MSFFASTMSFLPQWLGYGRSDPGVPEASSPTTNNYTTDDDTHPIDNDPPDSMARRNTRQTSGNTTTQRAQSGTSSTSRRRATDSDTVQGRTRSTTANQAPPAPMLCVICKKKPPYSTPAKTYPTCGNTCAAELEKRCEVCYEKPKAPKPNGGFYNTCDLACRTKLKTLQNLCGHCMAKPRAVDPKGKLYQFCGRTCRDDAQIGAPLPLSSNPQSAFETLKVRAVSKAPCVLDIPKTLDLYKSVHTFFSNDWKSQSRRPNVAGIFKIYQSDSVTARQNQYKSHLRDVDGIAPDESRRWVALTRKCQMSDSRITAPCKNYGCSFCDVLGRNVFNSVDFPRFVRLSGNSSCADRATGRQQDADSGRGVKVLLLVKVVSSSDAPQLSAEEACTKQDNGQGLDVVHLSPYRDGTRLPSDQLLVFNTDAIVPRYVILYQ
ncbi:hypothetical protein DFP72DRAFT_926222 [Ephemerocybe angulata]|uniref:Uncharacterized protein n=1 Tax=Ephemerocybe angulata TaxID=980116 RepID=A0A8H6HFQ9_9AGAR|nr:hypothetical protein DFP72DRAFT_926222 [Tulosesus angulatus]